MIIVLKPGATQAEIDHVIEKIQAAGCKPHLSRGVERTIIGAIGDEAALRNLPLEILPGVDQVMPIQKPYKLVSREFKPEPSVIGTGEVLFGGKRLHVIAGPCAVEGREMLLETARKVKASGATVLRGGAFKPRTSPYAFQGLEGEGLSSSPRPARPRACSSSPRSWTRGDARARRPNTRTSSRSARATCQNFQLLKELGTDAQADHPQARPLGDDQGTAARRPSTSLASGNPNVMLCERGIRTFENYTRNTLDISAVPGDQEALAPADRR